VLLDGAHNPAGARALAAYLDTLGPDGKLYLVFGAMKDKDIDGILGPILPHADKVFVTRAAIDRAAEIVPLEAAARKHHGDVTGIASAAEAVTRALALATPDDTVLVTGSLMLVGDVKRHLEAA
jgi:dihydrofolate synthase/folylpolyglutamate synthase